MFWVVIVQHVFGPERVCSCLIKGRVSTNRSQNQQPNVATGPNEAWAYDFVFDACANGQKLKCLTLKDEFTKECLQIDIAGSIKGKRVAQVLKEVIAQHDYPKVLRSDNGPEFVSTALLEPTVERVLRNLNI